MTVCERFVWCGEAALGPGARVDAGMSESSRSALSLALPCTDLPHLRTSDNTMMVSRLHAPTYLTDRTYFTFLSIA